MHVLYGIVLATTQATGTLLAALLLGAVALVFFGLNYPGAASMMLGGAHNVKVALTSTGLAPKYNFWVEFLIDERQLLFLFFTIAARIALTIVTSAVLSLFAWRT